MKVLVTGGSGFIGSHVVDRLLADGHEPTIFDLVPSTYHADAVESVIGDIVDSDAVTRALGGCDAVVHLAAIADVNAVVADPLRAAEVNVLGTQTVLEAARQGGIGRFLFGSTIWVYGNGSTGRPIDEETPLVVPKHPYTATKLAGEMYCHSYGELHQLHVVSLRFGIPHGPRSREAAVVAALVARARAGKALKITGDGTQRRQFVYVEDLAAGVVAALRGDLPHRVYNLVSEVSTSVLEIAETVRTLVAQVPIVHTPARPADLQIGEVAGTRARQDLDWQATTSFRQGVLSYLEWLTDTSAAPSRPAASMIDGSAETVRRHDPDELYASES